MGGELALAANVLVHRGSAYLYQGEELGLPEVDDLPDEVLQDPVFSRTGGRVRGRDGCRVPLPWSGVEPPYGFSPSAQAPRFSQPTMCVRSAASSTAPIVLARPSSSLGSTGVEATGSTA